MSLPLAQVASLDLYQGKAVYASDLKPVRYEYFPYLDDRWDYTRDGGVDGLDLRLAGSTYDKGLGLHSHSKLSYAVPPGCRRFDALVGLDDRGGRRGSVRIRLLADGKPIDLGGDRELTAAGGPLRVNVDVSRRQGIDAGSGLWPGRSRPGPRRLGGRPFRQVIAVPGFLASPRLTSPDGPPSHRR